MGGAPNRSSKSLDHDLAMVTWSIHQVRKPPNGDNIKEYLLVINSV